MDISIHRVTSIYISSVVRGDNYVCRTIVIEDEQGNSHEISLFTDQRDDNALEISV